MRTSVVLLCTFFILLSVVVLSAANPETPQSMTETVLLASASASASSSLSVPTAAAVSNCTTSCKSYVYVGVSYSYQQIGPETVVAWNVLTATATTVSRVTVDLYVSSQRYATFTLTDNYPVVTQNFNLSNGNIYGNGTFRLYPGYSSGSFGGVPQLGVNWESSSYGVRGGFNGSVIVFNANAPYPSNIRNITITPGATISLGWTACISRRFGSPQLVNATVWTYINNVSVGAAYLDLLRYPQQYLFYALGNRLNNSINATLSLAFTPQGIKVDAYTCSPTTSRNSCNRTNFYLFDVTGCPSNTFLEEERENRERYPNTPTYPPLASMSSSSTTTTQEEYKSSSIYNKEEKEEQKSGPSKESLIN